MRYSSAVKNEHIKLYSKRSTWVMLAIAFVSTLTFLLLFLLSGQPDMSKSEMILFLFQTENQVLYLLLIIAVTQIVCGEFATGTARMLFIRPVPRLMIVFSKFITSLIYAAILLVLNLLSCVWIALLMPGDPQFTSADLLDLLFITGVKLVSFLLYTSLFFAISLFTRNMTISIVAGIILMGSIQSLPSMIIFPNTSFLVSSVMWLAFCAVVFAGSVAHFVRSDIP